MNQLDWLRQHRYLAAIQREHDWLFAFDGHANLVVECLWRLVSSDRIVLTSLDDGQQFGLPAPIDATEAINSRLENAVIESITIRQGTLDLKLTFDTGHILEVIPDSSGYEAWNLHSPDQQYIAVSGGDLSVFTVEPNNRAEQSGEREPPITPDLKS